MRKGLVAAVVVSITAACSGSSGYTERTDPTEPTEPTEPTGDAVATTETTAPEDLGAAGAAAEVEVPDGPAIVDGAANSLIIVHDRDGGANALVSYRADGTAVTTYSTGIEAAIWQPIWSPDGRRIAWAQTGDGAAWELVTSAVDGDARTTHELPARPDYITYDPTASRILALTPSPEGFGLVIVELENAGDDPFTVADLGRPYFSDFSPGGDRLIAHVAADMRVVDLAGQPASLELPSTGHQTPAWHPTDDLVFFTTDTGSGERLVSHELDSETTTELTAPVDFLFFDLDPTGTRLAVSAFRADAPTADAPTADALRGTGGDQEPATLATGLWVVDLTDGATRQLDAQPSTAPMWDPTGTRVLVRDALSGSGRWKVFGLDGDQAATDEHGVDDTLLPAYLPFWDQYERSQTLWSPDGTHFVHVGQAGSGRSGAWIHDAGTSGPSTFLADGDVAFWSPT